MKINTNILMITAGVLVAALIGALVVFRPNKGPEVKDYPEYPAAVIERFYQEYFLYEGSPKEYESPFFTKSFVPEIKSLGDLEMDPFTCMPYKKVNINIHDPVYEGDKKAVVQVDVRSGNSGTVINVETVKERSKWKIENVICSENAALVSGGNFVVYFNNDQKAEAGDSDCRLVYGVERRAANTAPTIEEKLNSLFSGPTEEEKSQGYSSFFSESTSGILKSVKINGATAYVDLKDIRQTIPNASSSCGSASFMSQIEQTLKHDGNINEVIYAIDGDPQTFYDWVQLGCSGNICDKTPFAQQ